MKDHKIFLRDILPAAQEKSTRLEQDRLARECAKLDPETERAMAEEGMGEELDQVTEGLNEMIGS